MLVHPTHLVQPTATLSNEIFYASFLIENCVIFVCATTAKWISFPNHRNRKVVEGKHNVLVLYVDVFAPDLFGVVLCYLFIWDILWFIYFWSKIVWSKIHTFHYLNIPPGKLEHITDSLSSLGHISCEWEASSSQSTIILYAIAVYSCFPKLLIKPNQKDRT